jgi:hypothetical protein
MDELLRALPAILIVLAIIGAFVLASRVRNRTLSIMEANLKNGEASARVIEANARNVAHQTKLWEAQIASNGRLEELRRREIDLLERIATALESKTDQSHSR